MRLTRKQLISIDTVKFIKDNEVQTIFDGFRYRPVLTNDIYSHLLKCGKYRSYLTKNRFYSMLSDLEKRGLLERVDTDKFLMRGDVRSLPESDLIMIVVAKGGKWPSDIVDGLI